MARQVKVGDVFELETKKGNSYFQLISLAPPGGVDVIRILPGIYKTIEEREVERLIEKKELFYLRHYVSKRRYRYVGNYRVPLFVKEPNYYRDEDVDNDGNMIWYKISAATWEREIINELSIDFLQLSPWWLLSDPDIAAMLENGFTLDKWTGPIEAWW